MTNVMAALPNIGGALCSTPQSLANAHYSTYNPCFLTPKKQVKLWRVCDILKWSVKDRWGKKSLQFSTNTKLSEECTVASFPTSLSLFTATHCWTIYKYDKISRICSASLPKFNQHLSRSSSTLFPKLCENSPRTFPVIPLTDRQKTRVKTLSPPAHVAEAITISAPEASRQ